MYAKIPFNGGWTKNELLSVLQYLLGGGTSVASLPFGVKSTAEIVNTIPHGWTVTTSNASLLICNAPILNRTNARKHVRIDIAGTNQMNMTAGEASNTTDVQLMGSNVSKNMKMWGDGSIIIASYSIILHVSITPTRFITWLERVSTTDPLVTANVISCVSGISDVDFNDVHYSDVGTLLPFATFDRLESTSSTNTIVSVPKAFSGPRPGAGYVAYPKGAFVFGGISNLLHCRPPADGALRTNTGTTSYQQIYEFGVTQTPLDPVNGVCPDLFACSPNFAPHTTEHTMFSKTYSAVYVATGSTTLLIPKE